MMTSSRLLRVSPGTGNGDTSGRRAVVWLAIAGQAAGNLLPAGYLASGVLVLRILARRGGIQLLALRMLAIAGLLHMGTLLLIGLVAAQLVPARRNVPDLRLAEGITPGVLPITRRRLGLSDGGMSSALPPAAATPATALVCRLVAYCAVLSVGGICLLSTCRRSAVIPASAAGAHAVAAAQLTQLADHVGVQDQERVRMS